MDIHVLGQTELRLTHIYSEELNIHLKNDALRYSAIAMFVTSIARCTFAVLKHYAMRMEITTKSIVIHLTWDFIQDPTRVNQINMTILWPELPNKRINSVERASHKCTLSTTISDCVTIKTSVLNADSE